MEVCGINPQFSTTILSLFKNICIRTQHMDKKNMQGSKQIEMENPSLYSPQNLCSNPISISF